MSRRSRYAQARAQAVSIDRIRQTALIAMGWTILVAGFLIAPLPGPLGLPVMLVGAVILLRNSAYARRGFVRLKRRWPRLFHPLERVLRRRSR